MRKLHEKPDNDGLKLPRAEKESDEAQAVYEAINESISAELPLLLDMRIPYLDPSFEAMVRMHTKFAEDACM